MASFPLFHFWYDKVIVWVRFGVDGVLGYHMPNCLSDLNIQVGSPTLTTWGG